MSSSSAETSSSSDISISSSQASSNSATQEFGYCVFVTEKVCLETWGDCPPPAYFNYACPYSSVPSSSSVVATSGTFTDSRDNKVYKYVKIGTQTWIAENLNYAATGSKCGNGRILSNANTTTCDTYGRLYNWATAMVVCPSGWHLPNEAEWNVLMEFIGSPYSSDLRSWTDVGTKLKATSGWNDNGNGQDTYGFWALPGGVGYTDDFYYVGTNGLWWTASESTYSAYEVLMGSGEELAYITDMAKSSLLSVRCLQGSSALPSSSSSLVSSSSSKPPSSSSSLVSSSSSKPPSSSSSLVPSSSSKPSSSSSLTGTSGAFTDSRDSKSYKWVKIGTQIWMAQDLNYEATGSTKAFYLSGVSTCGRLYNWTTAMDISSTYNSTLYSAAAKHKGICPSGWHIPSNAEWTTLVNFVGSSTAGTKLKATSSWLNDGNGTDTYGFTALSCGYNEIGTSFYVGGFYEFWWSTSEYNANSAYLKHMDYQYNGVDSYEANKYNMSISVRCLKD